MSEKIMLCPMMQSECVKDGAIRNGVLVGCKFWVQIQGKHPQSGETLNHHDCAITWMPILVIENSKTNRETGAAVESFRNQVMDANTQMGSLFAAGAVSLGMNRGNPPPDFPKTDIISNDS